MEERELDLRRLVLLLWSRRVIFFAIVGSLTAVVLLGSLLSRSVWAGSVMVRVAQVGQVGQVGQPGSQLVEPIPRAAERLKMRDFQNATLRRAGLSDGERDPDATLFRGSLTARFVPTDLLRIEVRAYSPDRVRRLLAAVVDNLRQTHQELAAPAIQNLQEQSQQTSRELENARKDLAALRETQAAKGERSGFEASVYLASLVANKVVDVRTLEQKRIAFDEQLNPSRTYPTSVVDPIHLEPNAVSPRPLRNGLAAVFAGSLIGILLILSLGGPEARLDSRKTEVSEPVIHRSLR